MKVEHDVNNVASKDADLSRVAQCLQLTVGGDIHRIWLSRSQWELLARSAHTAVDDLDYSRETGRRS